MARFEGIDFYDLDPLFSEEERMVRDTIREKAFTEIFPNCQIHAEVAAADQLGWCRRRF